MFNVAKKVIESKNFELSAFLKKIDALWMQGSVTDSEREDLISLARKNANVQNSMDVFSKLEELDRRVKALEEERVKALYSVFRDNLSSFEYSVWRLYISGRTAREIGDLVGKDERSINNAIYRIRKKLRVLLR